MFRSACPKTLTCALAVALLPLSGCAETTTGAKDPNTITVYSGRSENLIGPLLEQFTKETGVKVDVKYGKSSELALLLSEEGKKSPADVFISQSPGAIGFVGSEGLLGKIPSEQLDKVNPELRSKEGTWVGMSGRIRTAVINTEKMKAEDVPASVFDLTDPKYKGKVGVAPTNGSFQDFVTAMRSQHGDEKTSNWLKGMAENSAPTFKNNSSIVKGVKDGEAPLGLVNHYYNARALKENPNQPTQNVFFKDGDIGSLLITTGIATIKTTKKADNANKLVDFMLGEAAQTFFAEKTMEYPLAKGAKAPEGLPALESVKYSTVDLSTLGGGLKKTLGMIEDSGLAKK